MKIAALLEKIDDHRLAYHDQLNPKLWDGDVLKTEVATACTKIAYKFAETLKISDSALKDVVLTGSNANYNWTQYSDVDVHLMVDFEQLADCEDCSVDVEDCLLAKKSLWNDRHDIQIFGHEVEVYVSNSNEAIPSNAACYSLLRSEWLQKPQMISVEIDSQLIKNKADELAKEIDQVVDTKVDDESIIKELTDKLWKYRQSGLQSAGEFSIENLVFKALRNNGYVQKIRDYAVRAQDKMLGLSEEVKNSEAS